MGAILLVNCAHGTPNLQFKTGFKKKQKESELQKCYKLQACIVRRL